MTLERSFETFVDSPLLGIGYKYGNSFTLCKQNGVGSHSELLDALAKYGIIGGVPLLLVFFFQVRTICRSSTSFSNIPFIILFIILFTFNPFLCAQTNWGLFLLIPMFINLSQVDLARVNV